jgi:hypothetical protein
MAIPAFRPATILDREFEMAKPELVRLTDALRSAIDLVELEAFAFKRKQPPPHPPPGLVETLAWFAVDVATAGIAGNLGAVVVERFTKPRYREVRLGKIWFGPWAKRTKGGRLRPGARRTRGRQASRAA